MSYMSITTPVRNSYRNINYQLSAFLYSHHYKATPITNFPMRLFLRVKEEETECNIGVKYVRHLQHIPFFISSPPPTPPFFHHPSTPIHSAEREERMPSLLCDIKLFWVVNAAKAKHLLGDQPNGEGEMLIMSSSVASLAPTLSLVFISGASLRILMAPLEILMTTPKESYFPEAKERIIKKLAALITRLVKTQLEAFQIHLSYGLESDIVKEGYGMLNKIQEDYFYACQQTFNYRPCDAPRKGSNSFPPEHKSTRAKPSFMTLAFVILQLLNNLALGAACKTAEQNSVIGRLNDNNSGTVTWIVESISTKNHMWLKNIINCVNRALNNFSLSPWERHLARPKQAASQLHRAWKKQKSNQPLQDVVKHINSPTSSKSAKNYVHQIILCFNLRSGDYASASGGRNGIHQHRTTAGCHFARHSVGLANFVPLVASPHRDNGKLGQDDGLSDGSGYLFGALNTETYVTIVVPNSDKNLEPGPLACPSLLLHGRPSLVTGIHSLSSFTSESVTAMDPQTAT
ncbi:hypothetical protein U0070_022638 [Myodes glareolus]|uniref:Uncharacterized protein n=1 Tax=Myodes glareolus TaxID=447135 RepID=A0AAW0IMN0_MYOGA